MFICTPCLRERFLNVPSITQSMGLCEFCTKMRSCSDIQSGRLVANPSYVDPDAEPEEESQDRPPTVLESIMKAPWDTVEKRGTIGFRQGVALLDGEPLVSTELAGRRVLVAITLLEDS